MLDRSYRRTMLLASLATVVPLHLARSDPQFKPVPQPGAPPIVRDAIRPIDPAGIAGKSGVDDDSVRPIDPAGINRKGSTFDDSVKPVPPKPK
jgi:hypothetical protein